MNIEALKNAPRGHKLLTKAIEKTLPDLYETDGVPSGDKTVYVKFFSPYSGWTWYGVEYDQEEQVFFGLVEWFDREWGYFSLVELENLGAAVERDLYFKPCKFKDLKDN